MLVCLPSERLRGDQTSDFWRITIGNCDLLVRQGLSSEREVKGTGNRK
jgi:hypothetical protein